MLRRCKWFGHSWEYLFDGEWQEFDWFLDGVWPPPIPTRCRRCGYRPSQ